MKVLFDASALLNIVRYLGAKALDHIKGCYELSLTPYEIGNVLKVTYYDSSYIVTASEHGVVHILGKETEIISSREYVESHS